jgi:RNA polymerase sigma factor (sigma-70 family)
MRKACSTKSACCHSSQDGEGRPNPQQARLTGEQQALALHYLNLARRLASRWKKSWPRHRDEFESAAYLALVEAARNFDASRNVKFATFATIRIRGALRDVHRNIARAYTNADFNQVSLDKVIKRRRGYRMACMLWAEPQPPVGFYCDLRDQVEVWLKRLPWQHAQVCRLLYIDGERQLDVTQTLGYAKSRVSNLNAQAVEMLKSSEQYHASRE